MPTVSFQPTSPPERGASAHAIRHNASTSAVESKSSVAMARSNTHDLPAGEGLLGGGVYRAVDPFKASVAYYANMNSNNRGPLARIRRRTERYPSLMTTDSPYSNQNQLPEVQYAMTAEQWQAQLDDEAKGGTALEYAWVFLTQTLPSQIYFHIMLRLPGMYWSRVARIFEEAEMSLPDIAKMITGAAQQLDVKVDADVGGGLGLDGTSSPSGAKGLGASGHGTQQRSGLQRSFSVSTLSPFEPDSIPASFVRLTNTWEKFIETCLKEWKTLNIVSVLLLSAIASVLQIEAAAVDPIIRTSALLSLVCALMSLLYGCMYSIRFYDMKKPYKAAQWAQEAQKARSRIIWNVWVFLAMPAVWLAWSIIAYLVCIMAYVWRTGAGESATSIAPHTLLGLRIAVSVAMFFGVFYFVLIARTLWLYGDPMDQHWRSQAQKWIDESSSNGSGRLTEKPMAIKSATATPSTQSTGLTPNPNEGTWLHSVQFSESPPQAELRLFPGPHAQLPVQPAKLPGQSSQLVVAPVVFPVSSVPLDVALKDGEASASNKHAQSSSSSAAPSSEARGEDRPYVFRPLPLVINVAPFQGVRIMEVGPSRKVLTGIVPPDILQRDITQEDWDNFIAEVNKSYSLDSGKTMFDLLGPLQETRTRLFPLLKKWNNNMFLPRKSCIVLCGEEPMNTEVSRSFALYLLDSYVSTDNDVVASSLDGKNGIRRVDVLEPVLAEVDDTQTVEDVEGSALHLIGTA